MPRYKPCGGGIPLRTAQRLPFPLEPIAQQVVDTIEIAHPGLRPFAVTCPRGPFAYMVTRQDLDRLLAAKAQEAGAVLLEGAKVRHIARQGQGFVLETTGGQLRCRYLVGADGVNSLVGRCLGLGPRQAGAVALAMDIRVSPQSQHRWRGRALVHLGYDGWGYAWVFPKADHLSVGLALPQARALELRRELACFQEAWGLTDGQVMMVRGHKILFRRGEAIAGQGALLVGDAAGLADEFTAEGIFYAVRSGELAAAALTRAAARGSPSLLTYQQAVEQIISPELRAARITARLFYGALRRAPGLVWPLTRGSPYLWRALFRVLRGESSYRRELKRAPLLPFIP